MIFCPLERNFSQRKPRNLAPKRNYVTSKYETTNSPIYEFKVLHKGQRAF